MELRVLRYFLAVAREETISGAAKYLHLSQPSLSRQPMDLEKELGKELFVRGNRRITLTDDGELLRKRASEIIMLVEKTESELRDTQAIDITYHKRKCSKDFHHWFCCAGHRSVFCNRSGSLFHQRCV